MKRFSVSFLAVIFTLLQCTAMSVRAETLLPASIVINEIQTNGTGSGTTLQEFIELTNVSSAQIDISGYKVVYTNSSNKIFDLTIFGIGTLLTPGEYILLTPVSATNAFLPDISPKISYVAPSSSGMAASNGKVSIINTAGLALDTVQWTSTANAAVGEIVHYTGDGKSIQRKIVNNAITVSANPQNDFEVLDIPTPQTGIIAPIIPVEPDPTPVPEPEVVPDPSIPDTPPDSEAIPPTDQTPPVPDPTNPDVTTEIPPAVQPEVVTPIHLPILINELYIDPTTPETDANDEWVEIYNPNDVAVDVTGYVVYSGSSFSYKYIFPAGSSMPSKSFVVLTSGATSLSLSNGGGAAKVVSPNAEEFDTTTYGEAPSSQAWAKNSSGIWEWTTTPTEEAANIITPPLPPALKVAAVSSAKTKKATTATAAKVTVVKAATTKTTKPKAASTSSFDEPALIAAPTPIPNWLLAVLIAIALLYVAYEYRFEVANSIYRFRNYRSARR